MSRKEQELLDIICNDRDPEQALSIAIDIIFEIAAQLSVSPTPHPSCFQEIP